MKQYRNLAGDSGVVAFEIGADSIVIQFSNGSVYRYNYASAGRHNVERMKILARKGRGLSTFISTTVRDAYAAKLS